MTDSRIWTQWSSQFVERPLGGSTFGTGQITPTKRVAFARDRSSSFRGRPEKAERDRQPRTRSMRSRKQKARDKRKVIDEKTEFGPIIAPMRRTMKRECEEEDVNRREERGFSEESPRQQANGQRQLEQRSQPGKELRNREAGRGDIGRRAIDIHYLECQCHEEDRSENQAAYQNGCGCPRGGS